MELRWGGGRSSRGKVVTLSLQSKKGKFMPTFKTGMAPALGYIMKQSFFGWAEYPRYVQMHHPTPGEWAALLQKGRKARDTGRGSV